MRTLVRVVQATEEQYEVQYRPVWFPLWAHWYTYHYIGEAIDAANKQQRVWGKETKFKKRVVWP